MSHGRLRHDNNCLNCGHCVEDRFCSHCGQENTETRQPFYFLITHFIEDFTHYDGQFWKTIKYILFKPGKLTKEYLNGKRQSFVSPVKLYIFISFITFLWLSFFPPLNLNTEIKSEKTAQQKEQAKKIIDSIKVNKTANLSKEDSIYISKLTHVLIDSSNKKIEEIFDLNKGLDDNFTINGYKTKKAYDSAIAKNSSKPNFISKAFIHKYFELKEKRVSKGDIIKSLVENSFHNLPKALFIYLPIFAFFLWLFHNKKKWFYFDHGVFTLHFFSFLLLIILFSSMIVELNEKVNNNTSETITDYIITIIVFYTFVYFYLATFRVYKEGKLSTFIKGFALFIINTVLISIIILGLIITSFLLIH